MSSLWYSLAEHQPLDFLADLPKRQIFNPDTLIAHTNAGGWDLKPYYDRKGNIQHIASHGQIKFDGHAIQYIPYNLQAFANWDANVFAAAWEMEDDGDPSRLCTIAQLSTLDHIRAELQVPRRLAPVTGGGVGWHSLHPEWNQSNHNCPGPIRVAQLRALWLSPLPTKDETMRVMQVTGDPNRGPRLVIGIQVYAVTTQAGVRAYADLGVEIRAVNPTTYDFLLAQSP